MTERDEPLPDDLLEPDDEPGLEPDRDDDGIRAGEHIGLTPPG